MGSSIIYRKAREEDCLQIAKLCDMASDGLVDFMFGSLASDVTPIEFLVNILIDPNSYHYSYKNTFVAECDGKVVGMVLGYHSRHHGIDDDMRAMFSEELLTTMKPFFDAKVEDSLYIDVICVDPDFRGMAIGKKLMDWAKQQNKRNRVSLFVFADNHDAVRFYQREGFKIVQRISMALPPEMFPENEMLLMGTT